MRCGSSGDLYPFLPNFRAISPFAPSAFSVISPHIWHSRLGHPGDVILSSLRSSHLIKCNKARNIVCHSCPLGKLIKLTFYDSFNYYYAL